MTVAYSDQLALASVLLTTVAILIAIGGIFAFLNIRASSHKVARDEANSVSSAISERIAVSYLERELPKLVREYRELARSAADHEIADEIAEGESEEEKE